MPHVYCAALGYNGRWAPHTVGADALVGKDGPPARLLEAFRRLWAEAEDRKRVENALEKKEV
jgi:hypothetical protein